MSGKRKHAQNRQRAGRRKPAVRVFTEDLHNVVPESAQFTRLCELEQKIDYFAEKARQEMDPFQEAPSSEKRTIRLYISHTAIPSPTPDDPAAVKWSLRIEGRLLEKPNATYRRKDANKKKFGGFVEDLVIEFNREKYGSKDNVVQWQRTAACVDADGFEITRTGALPMPVKISLAFEQNPKRYRLNTPLSKILSMDSGTLVEVNKAVWEYVMKKNLRNADKGDVVDCDEFLKEAFGVDTCKVSELSACVMGCLLPPARINLEHTIKLSDDSPQSFGEDVYDIDLFVDTLRTPNPIILSASSELNELEEQIQRHVEALELLKDKREFMLAFAEDPQRFILTWVASQAQNNLDKQSLGSLNRTARKTETFYQSWTPSAVLHYLSNLADEREEMMAQKIQSAPSTATHLGNPAPAPHLPRASSSSSSAYRAQTWSSSS